MKNNFVEEKNPTIVNFPLRGLDFKDCECRFSAGFRRLNILSDVDAPPTNQSTLYDLIANITLESVAGTTRDKENTQWKICLRAGGAGIDNEKWIAIQDLIVEETRKEMIFLGETVLQVCYFGLSDQRSTNGTVTDMGTPLEPRPVGFHW